MSLPPPQSSIEEDDSELEFAVPLEAVWEVTDHLRELYEDMYSTDMPYLLIELRFTRPATTAR